LFRDWVSSNGTNGNLPLVGDGSGDATFDPSAVPAGTYVITHTIGFGNCTTVCTAILTVYDAVDATINDIVMPCGTSPAGAIPLTAMFGSGTTLHGSFAGSGSGLIFGDALLYNQPGCYQVAYTASFSTRISRSDLLYPRSGMLVSSRSKPDL